MTMGDSLLRGLGLVWGCCIEGATDDGAGSVSLPVGIDDDFMVARTETTSGVLGSNIERGDKREGENSVCARNVSREEVRG